MLNKTLAMSRLTWAGHVKRMGYEKLTKRADALKVGGKKDARKTEFTMGVAQKDT